MRCQAVEPSHGEHADGGETWQPITKDGRTGGKFAKDILELVAAASLVHTFLQYFLASTHILFWNHITATRCDSVHPRLQVRSCPMGHVMLAPSSSRNARKGI